MSDARPTDVQRTSDVRPTDVQRMSVGRPTSVQLHRTSDGRQLESAVRHTSSVGRPLDVCRTSVGRPSDVLRMSAGRPSAEKKFHVRIAEGGSKGGKASHTVVAPPLGSE